MVDETIWKSKLSVSVVFATGVSANANLQSVFVVADDFDTTSESTLPPRSPGVTSNVPFAAPRLRLVAHDRALEVDA